MHVAGAVGTVGALVPGDYPVIVRVHTPDRSVEDWWPAYRSLFHIIASVGERHTSSADRAWFAVWEGHGFDTSTRQVAWRGPLDDATREWLDRERAKLRDENERQNTSIRAALREVPRVRMPLRVYYLLTGPAVAASELRDPSSPESWQRPDLFWPDDRRWFVATDVDFWSVYIGGDHDFISELTRTVPTCCEIVCARRPDRSRGLSIQSSRQVLVRGRGHRFSPEHLPEFSTDY